MSIPNRELSQFASFISINDVNKNIGITTDSTPYVGIGTTIPEEKLHVQGNIKASGFVSATEYYGDGSKLDNVLAVISGSFISTPSGIYTGSNVGIGTSTFTDKLNIGGSVGITSNLTAYTINSTAPIGIAPFTVQSSTLVPNLNAAFFQGRVPPSGNIVGDDDTQSLSNKTLLSPIISTIVNGSASLSVPTTSGTLIHTNAVGIITSGVYGAGSITNSHISNSAAIAYSKLNLSNSIVNSDINVGAGITYGKLSLGNSIRSSDIDDSNPIANDKLANSTISGVALGGNLATLTAGSYISGSNYNGSTATTWSVIATPNNVGTTVVARDAFGNIAAQGVFCASVQCSGDVVAFVSDIRLKTNIEPIENALEKILKLNGFTYTFNEIAEEKGFDPEVRHVGVSAQDVNAVIPEATAAAPIDGDYLTVKYEKLVALLIEGMKEQQQKIIELESKIKKLEDRE